MQGDSHLLVVSIDSNHGTIEIHECLPAPCFMCQIARFDNVFQIVCTYTSCHGCHSVYNTVYREAGPIQANGRLSKTGSRIKHFQ